MRMVDFDAPPAGEHVDVAGVRLALYRGATGGHPVVVFPGAGLVGLDFWNLRQHAPAGADVILYDRAGTGWSQPVDLPRTPTTVATECRAMLEAAGIRGPYLVVGHSLGAFYARRFAQLFPEQTSGLLLVDPGHEDAPSYMTDALVAAFEAMKPDLDSLPELTPEQLAAARQQYEAIYADWPDHLREPLIDNHLQNWRTSVTETLNFETDVYDELRAGGPLPHVPMIVLSALGTNLYWANFLSEEEMATAHAGLRRLHEAIAASVPGGELRELDGASHQYGHITNRDEVVRAIADLASKRPGSTSEVSWRPGDSTP